MKRRVRVRALATAFGGLALVLTLTAVTAVFISRTTRRQVDGIANDALVSVQLLGRMAADVYQEQKLVAEHIFEATSEKMAALEGRIQAVKADYAAAARDYETVAATFPEEAEAWYRLRDDVNRSEAPIAQALALSRVNRDAEAQQRILAIEPIFDDISRDVATSIELNASHARQARIAVQSLQEQSLLYHLALWCAGIGIALVLGIRVTRQFARAEEREREAFAVLEKRNRELDAFAGRVAHDFRAPLTTVKMAADLLGLPSPDVAKQSAVIQRGIKRMSAMIDDLLQLSQIEGAVRSDVCDPASVVNVVRDDMAERLLAEGATLQLAVEAARVNCREGLFQQVLSNLAENALKYRRPDVEPEIRISGRMVANQYELRVNDNGIGMSENEAARVFDPLFRARRLREVPGTGLGLSIVKRIVEASGGMASVESKLGQGSTFTIRLPLEPTR